MGIHCAPLAVLILSYSYFAGDALPNPKATLSYEMVDVGGGISLDMVVAGSGNTPMVLFHGYPETAWLWRGVIDPLLEDPSLKLYMPNQRGYNHSSKPDGIASYNISLLVADAVGLIKAVGGGKKVHIVGHDWGGMMVAWVVAGMHPELVLSLSIMNSPHPGVFDGLIRHNPDQQKDSSYQFFFDSRLSELMDPATDFAKESWYDAEDRAALTAAWRQPKSRPSALNWYRANIFAGRMNVREFTADMPTGLSNYTDMKIVAPTLVLWASGDPYFSMEANIAGLKGLVAHLTVKTEGYEGLGHWIAQAAPDSVAKDIREHIAKVAPSPGSLDNVVV